MKSEKFDSKARLAHLGRVKAERHAALRRALDEENRLKVTAGNARRLEAAKAQDGREIAAEAARKRAEEAEALVPDATARREEAKEAWEAAARLYTRCLEFAERNGLPLPERLDPFEDIDHDKLTIPHGVVYG